MSILCEGRGGRHRLRADYRAFPSRASIFQIDNVVGLGDQPGDFHTKRCFPSEINGCYYSLTFFFLLSKPCLACCQRCEQSSREMRQTEYSIRSVRGKEEGGEHGEASCIETSLGMKAEDSKPCTTSYYKQRLGLMHYLLAIILKSACIGRIH